MSTCFMLLIMGGKRLLDLIIRTFVITKGFLDVI